ncbi:HWE histidine kinase domain-containing protein [Phenylobacterium sp.]|uniref:sensor histidine kinase n=1 Tax=Phenylobacterium sp. TaxID=1871053 RepID=UPI0028A15916|nr:HWE histidine kinase domain-containing protein [Phenylobacterium sp.]
MADDEREGRWPSAGGGGEALLKAMLDASAVIAGVVAPLEDDYRFVMANRGACEFYGCAEGGLDGRTGRELGVTADQVIGRLNVLHRVLASGQAETLEYSFRFPSGRQGWFLGTFSPLPDEAGQVAFIIIDITERHRAQVEAERQGARLTLALNATELGLWEYDVAADRVEWDSRTRRMFGMPAEGDINYATYAAAVHPEDFPATRIAYEAALAGENDGHYVVEHRTTSAGARGSAVWVRGAARVSFDAEGRPTHVIGTSQDISAQVAARQRQDLLLGELNHRVKNNLAAVQAIASQTMRSAPTDPVAFRAAFDSRLQSLARGHDLLTRNVWEAADLRDVIEAALAPFSAEGFEIIGVETPAPLGPEMAVNLVMVLNELATNAAKYGALSGAGRVRIVWGVEGDNLTLHWRERGGPPVTPPERTGFGTRLTLSALQAYGGSVELTFPPEGAECRMSTPLARR